LDNFCPGGNNTSYNCHEDPNGCGPVFEKYFMLGIGALFIVAVLIMPYLGAKWAIDIAAVTGPMLILVFCTKLVRYRVFGRLTKQNLFANNEFDILHWNAATKISLLLAMVLLPFYSELRAILHTYYMRCLSRNFFADGADTPVTDLKDKCDYCPLLIMTGTSSDYRSPIVGDDDTINELSFSPLHCGSIETGYITQPHYRTLGKCTALTAAGCIDAVALTLSSFLTLRFWLQVMNLSWGTYILFTPEGEEVVPDGIRKVLHHLPRTLEACSIRAIDRLPSTIAVSMVWIAMFIGFTLDKEEQGEKKEWRGIVYLCAFATFVFIVFLAFVPFTWIAREMTQSVWIRQLLQLTGYTFRGDHPPPSLYITDGGCRDCTTLRQLLLRRQERILLILAASDPSDDLGVLKTAMHVVNDVGLANFYDPQDPRKYLVGDGGLLQEFKEDKHMSTLHMGISYRPTDTEPHKTGHLYIVKNRLPPDQKGHIVEPHLTVEEMCGEVSRGCGDCPDGVKPFDKEVWAEMTTEELGSFCCCDCMHTNGICGNCGPKFPHGSFANFMYMTPMWCSSLVRLGFDVSEDAVHLVSQPGSHAAMWEKVI